MPRVSWAAVLVVVACTPGVQRLGAAPDAGPDGDPGPGNVLAPDAGSAASLDGGPDGGAGPSFLAPKPGMTVYGPQTFPLGVVSVGVDEAGDVWAVDGNATWVMPPGGAFRGYTGVGQARLGFPSQTVCGGAAGKAYVGYYAPEIASSINPPPEVMAQGDVDRVALDGQGGLVLEHHYELHNSNSSSTAWFDEVRSIYTCLRVDSGPYQGEVYFGSNHAVTRVRGDDYADHRHVVWDDPPGSGHLVIGWNFGLAFANDGHLLLANIWKFGKIAPTADLLDWLDFGVAPWEMDGVPEAWGPPDSSNPYFTRAIAQAPDGRFWLGSSSRGLLWFDWTPRHYTVVANAPTSDIRAIVPEPDGSLWVGTGNAGLWRYQPQPRSQAFSESGTWTRLDGLPGNAVRMIHLETRFGARQLHVATDGGLAVYTEP